MPSGRFNKIRFGAGFTVTDEGNDIIRVEAGAGSGGVASDTIWDAKGDLAAGSGADAGAKLPVGTDGQVLVADSTQATGLRWATPSSSGGGASPTDTAAWMPLTTTVGGDDVLVFDDDHSLVPTLVPF